MDQETREAERRRLEAQIAVAAKEYQRAMELLLHRFMARSGGPSQEEMAARDAAKEKFQEAFDCYNDFCGLPRQPIPL